MLATNEVRLELDGYHTRSAHFSRDAPVKPGRALAAVLTTIPFLWIRDYEPEYRFELQPVGALAAYREAAAFVKLGAGKQEVLDLLLPTQDDLDARSHREPDRYVGADGVEVEIHYLRSNARPDGEIERSDYTPYVFEDGTLVSIGWEALEGSDTSADGGPK